MVVAPSSSWWGLHLLHPVAHTIVVSMLGIIHTNSCVNLLSTLASALALGGGAIFGGAFITRDLQRTKKKFRN